MNNKSLLIIAAIAVVAIGGFLLFVKKVSAGGRWKIGDILAGEHEGWFFEITITNVRFNSAINEWEYLYQHTGQLPQTWWVRESIIASTFGL